MTETIMKVGIHMTEVMITTSVVTMIGSIQEALRTIVITAILIIQRTHTRAIITAIPIRITHTRATTITILITIHTMKTALKCGLAKLQQNGYSIMGLVSHGSVAIPRTAIGELDQMGFHEIWSQMN